MRNIVYGLLCLMLAALCSPQLDAQQKRTLAQLMDDKLRFAKMLLEGVAVGDFNKVTRSSEQLIQISKTAEWFVHKTPRYEMHSLEFQRAAEQLAAKAKDKNYDGVALGYVELTMTCFRCHQYVRELQDVRAPARETDMFTARR